MNTEIKIALEQFEALLTEQQARAEQIKQDKEFVDYAALPSIVIGGAAETGLAL